MRSQLVFAANSELVNRFLLATVAMRATRKLHINSTPTEQTLNRVLIEIGKGRFVDVEVPELPEVPAIEADLIYTAA
jgi:hypothetical protein